METQTVLLVEDDPASLDIFATILRHGGYAVRTAQTAEAGVELAVAHRPDLVIVDLGLPGASGFDVLEALTDHPETETIPLIVCTVHVFEHDRIRARRAGGDVFLEKPVDPRHLLSQVRTLLTAAPPAHG
ncbi:MAG TPA: response regulator [Longimicrobium sp.]|nr:response regulator [Longimicrobium sp.]